MITEYKIYEEFVFKNMFLKKKYDRFRKKFDDILERLHILFEDFGDYGFATSITNFNGNIIYKFEIDFGGLKTERSIQIECIYDINKDEYKYWLNDKFIYTHGYQNHKPLDEEELFKKIKKIIYLFKDEYFISETIEELINHNTLEYNLKLILFTKDTYNFMVDYLLSIDEKYFRLIDLNRCSSETKDKWSHLFKAKDFDLI